MKSYGVTIQMKPLQRYFCTVLFFFLYFTKGNVGFFFSKKKIDCWPCESKRSEGGVAILPDPDCDSP